jgi:hypothetical protein
MNPAQIALQKALIRQLQSILGSCKGMLSAWETYIHSQEDGAPQRESPASPAHHHLHWRQ